MPSENENDDYIQAFFNDLDDRNQISFLPPIEKLKPLTSARAFKGHFKHSPNISPSSDRQNLALTPQLSLIIKKIFNLSAE